MIKSSLELEKQEIKRDIYGVLKEKDHEIETPYYLEKIEAGQTKLVSQTKEIDKDAISQVTILSNMEGELYKLDKNGNLKEIYVKIKANYMFIYDS